MNDTSYAFQHLLGFYSSNLIASLEKNSSSNFSQKRRTPLTAVIGKSYRGELSSIAKLLKDQDLFGSCYVIKFTHLEKVC
jgi:hypothetical protein